MEERNKVASEFLEVLRRKKRVRYSLPQSANKNVLVLAPHADDETIGCGGTLRKLICEGYHVEVVLFTEESMEDKNRFLEFTNALNVIGCESYYHLNYPDGELGTHIEEAIREVLPIIIKLSPGLIFSPYIMDDISDHKGVTQILYRCLSKGGFGCENAWIMLYEVWAPMAYADHYIDVSRQIQVKESALSCYGSQESRYHIMSKARKLNSFRADLSFRRNIGYMEAFSSLQVSEFRAAAEFLGSNGWFSFERKEEHELKKAVIFDFDGVIIDSIKIQKAAYEESYRTVLGKDPERFEEFLNHSGDSLANILKTMHLPIEMLPIYRKVSRSRLDLIQICPGIRILLELLHRCGYQCGLCTGKDRERTVEILEKYKLSACFDVIVCSDDVCKPKPAPESLLRTMELLGVKKECCIMAGDAKNDIICARNAEIPCIAVGWGAYDIESLKQEKPDFYADNTDELYACIDSYFMDKAIA